MQISHGTDPEERPSGSGPEPGTRRIAVFLSQHPIMMLVTFALTVVGAGAGLVSALTDLEIIARVGHADPPDGVSSSPSARAPLLQTAETKDGLQPTGDGTSPYTTIYRDVPVVVPIGGCYFQTVVDLDPARPVVWDKQYVDGDDLTYMRCTSSGFLIEGNALATLDDPAQDTPTVPTACLKTATKPAQVRNPRRGDVICIRTDRDRIVRMKIEKMADDGELTAIFSAWEVMR